MAALSPSRRFYPIALSLEGERVLMVGAGAHDSAARAQRLVDAGARVMVVGIEPTPEVVALASRNVVHWCARSFTAADARGCRLVIVTDRDPELVGALRARGRREGFWVGAVDQPDGSDFVHMAIVRSGPLEIGLSSSGSAPALLRRMREDLERGLDERFARFAERFARLRARLAPLPFEERASRLARALEGFELQVHVRYPDWESRDCDGEEAELSEE